MNTYRVYLVGEGGVVEIEAASLELVGDDLIFRNKTEYVIARFRNWIGYEIEENIEEDEEYSVQDFNKVFNNFRKNFRR